MIDKGKELDWFASSEIVLLAVVAVVGFMFFLAWELTEKNPIVDLRLFAQRNFLMGTLSLSVAYGLFFGNIVLLPLWLQQYMGYTATWAGMAMAPVGVLAIVLSPWVGKNVSKIDPRRLATVAFLGFALILWMRSRFNVQADFTTVLIPTIVQGAAMAFFFIPLQAIIFSGLTPDRMPAAAGLSNFVRITAGAVGTSLFTTAWENRAVLHHADLAESINNASAATTSTLDQLGAAGYSPQQALGTINRIVDQQAYTLAATDLFLLSSAIFVVLIAMVWMTRPGAGRGGRCRRGALSASEREAARVAGHLEVAPADARAAGIEQLAEALPVDRAGAGARVEFLVVEQRTHRVTRRPASARSTRPDRSPAKQRWSRAGAARSAPRRRRSRAPRPRGGRKLPPAQSALPSRRRSRNTVSAEPSVEVHADPVPAHGVGVEEGVAPFVVEPGTPAHRVAGGRRASACRRPRVAAGCSSGCWIADAGPCATARRRPCSSTGCVAASSRSKPKPAEPGGRCAR